jgi:putative ABC transport system ATP-binding protein
MIPSLELADPVAPVVQLTDLARSFPGPPLVDVLEDIDLTISAGEYVSIVGPSGSGKSTLLNILGLLDTPTAGIYRLDGIDTAEFSDNDRAAVRCERIGFVFQGFHLMAHRTTTENVELAELYSPTAPRRGRRERAIDALERVGSVTGSSRTPRPCPVESVNGWRSPGR